MLRFISGTLWIVWQIFNFSFFGIYSHYNKTSGANRIPVLSRMQGTVSGHKSSPLISLCKFHVKTMIFKNFKKDYFLTKFAEIFAHKDKMFWGFALKEEFKDTKEIIRIRISKNIHHNGQKKSTILWYKIFKKCTI